MNTCEFTRDRNAYNVVENPRMYLVSVLRHTYSLT